MFNDLLDRCLAEFVANIRLSILPFYIVVLEFLILAQMPHYASYICVGVADEQLLHVVLVVHRRQCLKQLDILAAVYGRVSFGNIFSLELVDGISGFLVVVADPVHLVSDFKPINPSAMQGVTAVK